VIVNPNYNPRLLLPLTPFEPFNPSVVTALDPSPAMHAPAGRPCPCSHDATVASSSYAQASSLVSPAPGITPHAYPACFYTIQTSYTLDSSS